MAAWLSFLGGYAKGANEEIDKQREKEEQYIQDRMKMAAATRLQKQKEAEAQRKELEEAKGTLSAIPSFASAKPEQQIALLASPVIRKQFIDRTNAGEMVDLDNLMEVNADKLKAYPTVDSYIQSFKAKPKTAEDQTMAAFQQPRRAFGATTGTDEEGLRQNAARFGMTPEEALGWEAGAEDMPSTSGFATLKPQALAPHDIDGQRKLLESEAIAAQRDLTSSDPVVAEKAKSKLEDVKTKAIGLKSLERIIEGGPEKAAWQDEYNGVMLAIVNSAPGSPERKRWEARKIDMEKTLALGKEKPKGDTPDALKPATFSQLRTAANDAMLTALRMQYGADALKGVSMVQVKQPDGSVAEEVRFNKLDTDLQKQQYRVAKAAAMAVLAPYVKEGKPTTEPARLLMTGLLSGDVGTAAPTVTPPPKPQPTVTPPAKPAAGGKTKLPVSRTQIEANIDPTLKKGSKEWQREYDANKAMMIGAGYTVLD